MNVVAGRPAARAVAWSLAGLTVLTLAATLVLLGLDVRVISASRILFYMLGTLALILCAGIGRLIASRVPGNAIGWLLIMIGLLLAASLFAEQYALHGLAAAPGSLPSVRQIGALSGGLAVLPLILLVILVLLFPDGRLPSRRWRPVLWGTFVAIAGATAQQLQGATTIDGGLTNALLAAGVSYRSPGGVFPRHGWFGGLLAVIAVIALVTAVLTVVSVFVRRRGANPELRQQLAWLGYVGVLALAWLALLALISLTPASNGPVSTLLWALLVLTPIVGIPVASAVAVLRYRLYDLDVVVRRTVVAGLVAAAFTAIYAVVVVGVGAVTGRSGDRVLTFAAAALAAVALQPVRIRAGLLADRLVYGRRATPYEVLSGFADRLAGTYSTEEVLPQMARMLAEATGAERAEVWLRGGGEERLEAAWPQQAPAQNPAELPAAAAESGPPPADPAVVGEQARDFAVEHHGERLGTLRVTCSPREPLTPAGERLVRDVAAQAGLVLRNVGLIEDLRASRQRLITAADEARRRLERNLHDGAQQQLVALRISLGLARQVLASAPDEAADLLAQTEGQAEEALAELRELAHGIYPPLLADLGLRGALQAQARKAAVPVTVDADSVGRYSQETEAALYFCILEALQNVAKYAHASGARVTLRQDGPSLTFTVADDGQGFDRSATPMGTGVQGMSDRLAALGGTIEITSAPGQGTQVTGRVPVAPAAQPGGSGQASGDHAAGPVQAGAPGR
jgi:signal transduction histidine kinase